MQLPYTIVFEPPTADELAAALRTRAALALLLLLLALLGATGAAVLGGWWPVGPAAEPGPEPDAVALAVTSEPNGATVWVDGRERGRTPTTLSLTPGPHTLVFRQSGWLEARVPVELEAGADREPPAISARLWRQQPAVTRLRPIYPGATIADASFLRDGRVALAIALPPADERQGWLLEPATGGWRRVGPADARAGAIDVAPDGTRVAYLARGGSPGALGLAPERLDELWVAPAVAAAGDPAGRGTRRYALPARPSTAGERLVDLRWAPDSRHLLLVLRQQPAGATSGQTRLLWLDADAAAEEPPRQLAALPSDLVPGSYAWAPDGQRVAFLARTESQLVALCLVDTAGSFRFRYVADLGREDGARPLAMPPLAWTPDSAGVIYAAPAPGSRGGWPLSGASRPSPALFVLGLADVGDARRLGEAAGAAPVWRGTQDLLVLARTDDGRLGLRTLDPAGGQTTDLAALPLKVSGPFAARWDVASGQALVAVRGSDTLGAAAATEYWLIRFLPGEGPAAVTRAAWSSRRRAALVATGVALLALLLASPPAFAQEEAPMPPVATATPAAPSGDGAGARDGSGGGGFLPDPRQWAGEVFTQVLLTFLRSVTDGLGGLVQGVLGSSANVIGQTPPALSYGSPTVQALRTPVLAVANAALALVAVWGGFNLMLRQHLGGAVYHEALELFPRLALGALLINTSSWWARLVIDLNNALCQLVGQASPPGWEQADGATQALVSVLATLVYLVAALLLVLQMLLRLALVDVLLVVAPLGLLCWVLPQTAGWARTWSSVFARLVFTQFVQVVALKLGTSLITELRSASPDAMVMAPFLGIAALLVVLKVPGLVGGQGGGLGFVQYLAYRQGASALGVGASHKAGRP